MIPKSTKSLLNAAAGPEAALSPEELVQQLRAIRERIPLADPSPAPAALRRRLAHVNAEFVQASINAAAPPTSYRAPSGARMKSSVRRRMPRRDGPPLPTNCARSSRMS